MPGGRGRKKLKALDVLDGNPSRREIEHLGIESQTEPFIPEHLQDDARGCIEVIKRSMPRRVYSALDSFLLAAFGLAWAMQKEAAIAMSAPGFKLINKSGHISRWFAVFEKTTDKMLSLSAKLGLDPVTRQSMKVPGARQQVSKFARLDEPSVETLAAQNVSLGISNFSKSPAAKDRAVHSD